MRTETAIPHSMVMRITSRRQISDVWPINIATPIFRRARAWMPETFGRPSDGRPADGTPTYLSPDRRGKYFYYGRQRRWIFVVFLLAFLGVTFGLARLALNSAFSTN
jgi:hypothetical protein